jgi:hypothetical protein
MLQRQQSPTLQGSPATTYDVRSVEVLNNSLSAQGSYFSKADRSVVSKFELQDESTQSGVTNLDSRHHLSVSSAYHQKVRS